MLTQKRLKELLHYDQETGVFTWINSSRKGWNGKKVGALFNVKTSRTTYLRAKIGSSNYLLHRLAFLYMDGHIPDIVDHKDEVGTNNKWINLRAASNSQNIENVKLKANNTSGHKNVTWFPQTKKWRVSFRRTVNGKQKILSFGLYSDINEAVAVAKAKREELHGDFCNHG